jgi:hypothetical protein
VTNTMGRYSLTRHALKNIADDFWVVTLIIMA